MITHLAAIVATCFSPLPRTEPLDLELPAASRLALPQSVAWEKHMVFRSTFANRLFDGRERTWDPDTIVVYYFVDAVMTSQPPAHQVTPTVLPIAELLLTKFELFLIAGDMFAMETPEPTSADMEFGRGLCRFISWKFRSPMAKTAPESYRVMALKTFERGIRGKDVEADGLDYKLLCRLGVVMTSTDPKQVDAEAKMIAKLTEKKFRWIGMRCALKVAEDVWRSGEHAEARKLAKEAVVTYKGLEKWDSYRMLGSLAMRSTSGLAVGR